MEPTLTGLRARPACPSAFAPGERHARDGELSPLALRLEWNVGACDLVAVVGR